MIFEASGLSARSGATPVLRGMDLAVGKREIVAVIGRNRGYVMEKGEIAKELPKGTVSRENVRNYLRI